ncbi:hypothetical protein E1B28_005605 [Marasmius oreades]|uniref:non-specific serine/threonine protein kinase n=1 Tax=Marasmius oreades TaxID=181124 RepID=A0A9P7UV03_9AGAR|nr:uncharacterized protein E1B28_005605 [Marasmius oreades]KAG7094790.1 hypothetical protein E1B28_005605 [Marasmius oreades]
MSTTSSHPPLGTLIDDDSLELVEILGVGGYGVVYRAEDVCSPSSPSYAVKCLPHNHSTQPLRQRQAHMREIALHQIAGAHPNVVTLHRVVEDYNYTYIIMDYAPDHDLFSQILHRSRYLGDDYLIRHVFLQILDAVEYCHQLGIYHRDLKPENILCFDDGLRVAITDFGLATTDKLSEEFRTGSIYHMSPECQGGDFAIAGPYSPMFNDIWSLGIILLNLATGRNPWKSASASDPTFQAYIRDPFGFLPTVLPISQELNAVLVRMLEIEWRQRMTIPELRQAIEEVDTFYSEGAIFEGSMARCPWEAGMEIDSDSSTKQSARKSQPSKQSELKSCWSQDSAADSDIIFAHHTPDDDLFRHSSWVDCNPRVVSFDDSEYDFKHGPMDEECCDFFAPPQTPRSDSLNSSVSTSFPITPSGLDSTFGGRAIRKPLVIDTSCGRPHYYDRSPEHISATSSLMKTAVEFIEPSSALFLSSAMDQTVIVPQSVHLGDSISTAEDREMTSPTIWTAASNLSSSSSYSSLQSSYTTTHISFDHRSSVSPESASFSNYSNHSDPQLSSQPPFPLYISSPIDVPSRPLSPTKKLLAETQRLKSTLFTPLRFFPRLSASSPATAISPSTAVGTSKTVPACQSEIRLSWPPLSTSPGPGLFVSTSSSLEQVPSGTGTRPLSIFANGRHPTPSPTALEPHKASEFPPAIPLETQRMREHPPSAFTTCRRAADYLRSPRYWFLPTKFFASHVAS